MTKLFRGRFFGPPCSVDITFSDAETRQKLDVLRSDEKSKDTQTTEPLFVFENDDAVKGTIAIVPLPGKEIEHQGIKVELIGQIQLLFDRVEKFEFTSLSQDVADPGVVRSVVEFPFEFNNVDKAHESYQGVNARLRYFLRVTVVRQYATNITREQDVWVQKPAVIQPQINSGIKMEVGIEDALHIEFEYDKSKYHLQDVILGKIYFLLIKIPIKHMEIDILRRESTGTGNQVYNETETIAKYEIMDGIPESEECVPIRMFLKGYSSQLTPTYSNVAGKFSVKYYLNLVLVDEEERKYFKQQEIVLWRKDPKMDEDGLADRLRAM